VRACALFVYFAGVLPAKILHAQQTVAVAPEVKQDVLRRLEFAKTWEMPKQKGYVHHSGLASEKDVRNACNGKADHKLIYSQSTECGLYQSDIGDIRIIDDIMPQFKACATDVSMQECSDLFSELAIHGFYDYAFAVVELGYVRYIHVVQQQPLPDERGIVVHPRPGQLALDLYGSGQKVWGIDNPQDVQAFLRNVCLALGAQHDSCKIAHAVGIQVTDQELTESRQQLALRDAQAEQENDVAHAQYDRAADAHAAKLNALNNMADAVGASTPTIQETAAQQQANLQAMAAAAQQRQQAQARVASQNSQSTSTTSTTTVRSSSGGTIPTTPATSATPSPSLAGSGYNPYTGTGSGSIQGSCTDMTASVKGSVKVGSDGWVIGYLTNNSTEAVYVSYTFKQNGVPSKNLSNTGGTTIQGGQTVGGELQGLYSTEADKNPAQIYWYAVRQADHDKYGCAHQW
jgi:hypothetical protein